ncbi:RICIN domain-containing protein [Lysobacter firmicutimachus]|uniref:RICIN domain-containing protein n=1 Tax=Lysobacter firmicutimachus TaxID=1792846 RepID=A0ABU8CXL5_9GAMM
MHATPPSDPTTHSPSSASRSRGGIYGCIRYLNERLGAGLLALGLVAASAPALADYRTGNIYTDWSVEGASAEGLEDITFTITVHPQSQRHMGMFVAQQFFFVNGGGGYIGLQPKPDSSGRQRLHGIFSTFDAGSTENDPNCVSGADGDADGVSCGFTFYAEYGHPYALTVQMTAPNTWTGTATDTVTGVETHIGTFTESPARGNLKSSGVGFIEHWYSTVPSCLQLPRIDTTLAGAFTTAAGGLSGTIRNPSISGSTCATDESGYSAAPVGNGLRIGRGWITETAILKGNGSGRCLDVPNANPVDGARLQIYDCNSSVAQQFHISRAKTLMVMGKCVDVANRSTALKAPVQIGQCNASPSQTWELLGNGSFRNTTSGYCLNVTNNGVANGTSLQLYQCNGKPSQIWTRYDY